MSQAIACERIQIDSKRKMLHGNQQSVSEHCTTTQTSWCSSVLAGNAQRDRALPSCF